MLLAVLLALCAEPLFDGKSLAGWSVEGARAAWSAEDGMIRCKAAPGSFGYLRYEKRKFADFALRLEYRFEKGKPPGRSALGFRAVPFDPKRSADTRPSSAGYQIPLKDDAGRKPDRHSTASLEGHVAASVQAAKPAPEWNVLEVECRGPVIRVTLNGKKAIDFDQSKVASLRGKPLVGYISLENHGSRVDFRNITIRPLK